MSIILTEHKGEARVDTRLLAEEMGLQHQSVYEQVKDFKSDFEQLGVLRFETGKPGAKGGRPEQFALLNEDQAYLLLTFSRNTRTVRALKVKLVLAFKEARAGRVAADIEYLPGYHALHDKLHDLAAGSSNERFVHMNVNKLINKTVGIEAGQRDVIATPSKAAVIVAQQVAAAALGSANDHHDGYEKAKAALGTLGKALLGRAA